MEDRTKTIGLTALFVTCLVTAQILAVKLVSLKLPIMGFVVFPAGTMAYAGTFFATDVVGELYGKEDARRMVNSGFLMNFVLLILVYLAINAPIAENSIPQSQYATVLGFSANVVFGSLVAYIISQHWDVLVFHTLRRWTNKKHLWLRNILSTGTSQFIDTVMFSILAFSIAPTILGIGFSLSLPVITSIIIGQYVVKVLIALVDTPLVYLATRNSNGYCKK